MSELPSIKPPNSLSFHFGRGFTLLELLVVMAIIAMVVTLSMVSIQGIGPARNLNTAGAMVADQIALARQIAISKSARVRWQLIEVAHPETGQDEAFRLIRLQIFDPKARGWHVIGRPQLLPTAIIAVPDNSSLLDSGALHTIQDLTYGGISGQTARAAVIPFRANGRVSLDPNEIHFMTLKDPKNAHNFVTIQIDPVSGQTRTFRP